MNIFQNSFCAELKYVLLEDKLFHPECDSYMLSIHYCCSLTDARVCDKEDNHLQSWQGSLWKCVWISGRVLALLQNIDCTQLVADSGFTWECGQLYIYKMIFQIIAWNQNILHANDSVLVRTSLHTITTLVQWAGETIYYNVKKHEKNTYLSDHIFSQ